MKKQLALLGLVVGILLSSVGTTSVSASGVHYKDVNKEDNFYDAVEYLLEKGAISKTLPHFRPYENITRGQFASIYAKANDYKVQDVLQLHPNPIFKDVPKNHQFYPYVQAMYPNVMTGYSNYVYSPKYFGINDNLTRGQFAGILVRNYGLITAESYIEHGGTVSDIFDGKNFKGQWGQHIATLETIGIMNGYGDGTFKPNEPIKRSQFVNMLYKALGVEVVRDTILTDYYKYEISSLRKLGITDEVIFEKVKSLKENDVMNYVDSYENYWWMNDADGFTENYILEIRKEGEILFEDINVKMIVTKDQYGSRKFVFEKIKEAPLETP
nr:S-layer homology domain-containing protein [Lysinibacillus timonensis]